jgi:hypothetical protein
MQMVLRPILLIYLFGLVLLYIFSHGLHKPVRKSYVIAYLVGLGLYFLPGSENSAEKNGLDTLVIFFSVIVGLFVFFKTQAGRINAVLDWLVDSGNKAATAARLKRIEAWHNRIDRWLKRFILVTLFSGIGLIVFQNILVLAGLSLLLLFPSAFVAMQLAAMLWLVQALHELHRKYRSLGTILLNGSLGIIMLTFSFFFVSSLLGLGTKSMRDVVIIVCAIVIALILLAALSILRRTISGRPEAALESSPEPLKEPESDDEDFISLKAALSNTGVEHEHIKLLKNLPAEGEYAKIFGLIIPGEQAFTTWLQLRALVPQTSRWPLIMGDLDIIDSASFALMEQREASVQDILDLVKKVDIEKWVADAVSNDPDRYAVPPDKTGRRFGRKYPSEDREALEDMVVTHRIEPIMYARPLPHALIGLLPVREGWKVPAVMKWGGWNDCPAPEIHCAVLKDWSEKYGADLVGIADSVLDVIVDRTPEAGEKAIELATLHSIYNEKGWSEMFVLEELAVHIHITQVWTFWWEKPET